MNPIVYRIYNYTRRGRASSIRPAGTFLSDKHLKTLNELNSILDSFTKESTYDELKKILENLIIFDENDRTKKKGYHEPYYGEIRCEKWVEKMKNEEEYVNKHLFYNIASDKDNVIYTNSDYYFKTIMFAFVYGLDLNIPSLKRDISLKFIELLKLIFKKYDYKNFDTVEKDFIYLIFQPMYYMGNVKRRKLFLENTEKFFFGYPFPHTHNTLYRETIIQYSLKKTLLKYNSKYQKSEDSKIFLDIHDVSKYEDKFPVI